MRHHTSSPAVPRLPLAPDGLPRLGATTELRAEFRALTRRLLAFADSLPSAGGDQGAPTPRPAIPPHAPAQRSAKRARAIAAPLSRPRLGARPTPPPSRAAALGSSSPAAGREGAGPRSPLAPRLVPPSAPPAASAGELRLRSGDDLATALACRVLPGTGDSEVLVRQVRARVPEPLSWVRSLLPTGTSPAISRVAVDARGTLFLDIETAGLANAPILLVGCARIVGTRLVLRQYLATDYPSEEALLRAVARELARSERVVTFNGASFDLPAIRDRSILWGVSAARAPHHVDLLPLARRRWRTLVANCRLGTLEAVILGRVRRQDLPSREVPEQFHRFVRTADPSLVAPILRHNAFDVISMAGLAVALGVPV